MKCVLHFATKLNSRDIKTLQKSSQIEKLIVISAFSATGGRGCGGKVIWHKKVEQSFANQSLDPPIKNSWICPWLGLKSECGIFFNRTFSGCYAILISYNNSKTAVYGYNPALF